MPGAETIPRFGRGFMEGGPAFSRLGGGEIGGKARGLLDTRAVVGALAPELAELDVQLRIPTSVVIGTEVFEAFMKKNDLWSVVRGEGDPAAVRHAFEQGALPAAFVGDLRDLTESSAGRPLAVRSSSQLEDALEHPFAGVYATKMIPNHGPSPSERAKALGDALKCVYASCFSPAALAYRRALGLGVDDERMAVVVQEVVGERHHERLYPHVSAVARSFNAYRFGRARPEEGVVSLALGLGKTIVDGGLCWTYCPSRPRAPPPFASAQDTLRATQTKLWAVHLGKPPPHDPLSETEHLVQVGLPEAEYDDTLRFVASTYDPARDRIHAGVFGKGPRVLDFAPMLQHREVELPGALARLLGACAERRGHAVELEAAAVLPGRAPRAVDLALLQVRPMRVVDAEVDVEAGAGAVVAASEEVMGNGRIDHLEDVIYLDRAAFDPGASHAIAREVRAANEALAGADRDYLLIGFGRWGSSDPWLGVPVSWADVSRARAIVEATRAERPIDPSQGAHFFHNLMAFEVAYFSLAEADLDWRWLEAQPTAWAGTYVRHARLPAPLSVAVDARSGRGVIRRPDGADKS